MTCIFCSVFLLCWFFVSYSSTRKPWFPLEFARTCHKWHSTNWPYLCLSCFALNSTPLVSMKYYPRNSRTTYLAFRNITHCALVCVYVHCRSSIVPCHNQSHPDSWRPGYLMCTSERVSPQCTRCYLIWKHSRTSQVQEARLYVCTLCA